MSGHPFDREAERIWKYPLEAPGIIREHQIPRGSPIVHVGADPSGEGIALWAHVDPDVARDTRRFLFVGTGDGFPDNASYVGSAILTSYAWHVFELL